MAAALDYVQQGVVEGRDEWCQLLEGFHKLMLLPSPTSTYLATEVRRRIDLWNNRDFETLLRRIEMQTAQLQRQGRGSRRGKGRGARRGSSPAPPTAAEMSENKKAKVMRLLVNGALGKASEAFVQHDDNLPPEDHRKWGVALFPPPPIVIEPCIRRHLGLPMGRGRWSRRATADRATLAARLRHKMSRPLLACPLELIRTDLVGRRGLKITAHRWDFDFRP